MDKETREAIRGRATAPRSLAFDYTHYRDDVTALLTALEEAEQDRDWLAAKWVEDADPYEICGWVLEDATTPDVLRAAREARGGSA